MNKSHAQLCYISRDTFIFDELRQFIDSALQTLKRSSSNATNRKEIFHVFIQQLTTPAGETPSSLGLPLPLPSSTQTSSEPLAIGESIYSGTQHISNKAYAETTATSLDISPAGGQGEDVSSIMDFAPSIKLAKLPCYWVFPTPNPMFFGRNEVLTVLGHELLPSIGPMESRSL